MVDQKKRSHFRSRARLLQHLGDQLIGTPRLAVFELVKNAYDADASFVEISLNGIGSASPNITVIDDGVGMSAEIIENVWLVIAHDNKQKLVDARTRTEKGRLPLGSKGLGRLSVHKLGNRIELVSRAKGCDEIVVSIDWTKFIEHEYLEDADVGIHQREPEVFRDGRTGTRIRIDDLRERHWTRGEIRRLYRQITSISSPFGTDGRDGFEALLKVPDHPQWIERLPDPEEILKRAPWRFDFSFDGKSFSYEYTFRRIPGIARESRTVTEDEAKLLIPPPLNDDDDPLVSGKAPIGTLRKVIADTDTIAGVGPVKGTLYVFDLSPKITSKMGEIRLIKDFLDENGGIRVYRDGIRVYDYGEKNNDWLGLDLRRVNNPTKGLSRNIVVGHIDLDQSKSSDLVEKSNREGFIENAAYERFRRIVLGAIEPLQREREQDRRAIRELLGEARDPETKSIIEPVTAIREIARKRNISAEVDPLLERIEREYVSMKERLLTAGMSGTNLAVVFHEIEQGVRALYRNLTSDGDVSSVVEQVSELMRLLDGFSDLLRKHDRKPVDLKKIVKRARDLSLIRFRHHNVQLDCPPLEDSFPSTVTSCSFGLTLGALTNLIDNAIFWLRTRWPEGEEEEGQRAIYIGIDADYPNGPAIIVADNGPGFEDSPSELVRPFYSRRPEGMGMGLYYANMVMELNDGELIFPDNSEVDVPDRFDGAVIALRFSEHEV